MEIHTLWNKHMQGSDRAEVIIITCIWTDGFFPQPSLHQILKTDENKMNKDQLKILDSKKESEK